MKRKKNNIYGDFFRTEKFPISPPELPSAMRLLSSEKLKFNYIGCLYLLINKLNNKNKVPICAKHF